MAAVLTTVLFSASSGWAEPGIIESAELPSLGNTEDNDRILVQEITDEHIAEPQTEPFMAIASDNQRDIDENQTNAALANAAGAWDRVRAADRLPRKRDERVDFYLQQYKREVLWINKILNRGTPFIGYIVNSLESRFMPVELALLPAIESGFQAHVKSSGNAAGIWQIVPITAKEIGIERNEWFDGRGNIARSTTAAIDYLSYLNAEFNGDWELTLAAYNAGPGRIRGAIKKNREANKPTDFWSLDLPKETHNYVPKIVAMIELIKDPETTGLLLPDLPPTQSFTTVDVGKRISIDQAAIVGNLEEQLLLQLNAGLIHRVTPPRGPHTIVVPSDSAKQFLTAVKATGDTKLYSLPQTHIVKAGDSISTIAQKYGISQRKLRELNGLDDSRILIGQRLGVIDVRGVNNKDIEYIVKIGDTLSEIAERYSVKINAIRNSTGQSPDHDVIHPGEKLTITVGSQSG
jgi:membrane-bound lytic murein transglycosylase D